MLLFQILHSLAFLFPFNQFSNVPGKCHPFEFWKVSREKLNSAVQLAQHDMRRKKNLVPKNMLPRHMCSSASVACGDRQEVHNVVTRVAGTGLVNNTQRKHLKEHKIMKKVRWLRVTCTTFSTVNMQLHLLNPFVRPFFKPIFALESSSRTTFLRCTRNDIC